MQTELNKRLIALIKSKSSLRVRVQDLDNGDVITSSICATPLFIEKNNNEVKMIPIEMESFVAIRMHTNNPFIYGSKCKMFVLKKVL